MPREANQIRILAFGMIIFCVLSFSLLYFEKPWNDAETATRVPAQKTPEKVQTSGS